MSINKPAGKRRALIHDKTTIDRDLGTVDAKGRRCGMRFYVQTVTIEDDPEGIGRWDCDTRDAGSRWTRISRIETRTVEGQEPRIHGQSYGWYWYSLREPDPIIDRMTATRRRDMMKGRKYRVAPQDGDRG